MPEDALPSGVATASIVVAKAVDSAEVAVSKFSFRYLIDKSENLLFFSMFELYFRKSLLAYETFLFMPENIKVFRLALYC